MEAHGISTYRSEHVSVSVMAIAAWLLQSCLLAITGPRDNEGLRRDCREGPERENLRAVWPGPKFWVSDESFLILPHGFVLPRSRSADDESLQVPIQLDHHNALSVSSLSEWARDLTAKLSCNCSGSGMQCGRFWFSP